MAAFNPKICIGVCREDFLVNQDLSKQKNVWCMNLKTGDVFTDRRWREYYDVDGQEQLKTKHKGLSKFRHNRVEIGTIIGILLDMDRGLINFFKDGKDLGQAFCQP